MRVSRPYVLLGLVVLGIPIVLLFVVLRSAMQGSGAPPPVAKTAPDPTLVLTRGPTKTALITLDTAPATFGENRFLLTVRDSAGQLVSGAQVRLVTTMLDMAMGSQQLNAKAVGAGRYQASGLLGMPGHWRIVVSAGSAALPGGTAHAIIYLAAASPNKPMPTLLPLLGQRVTPTATPTLVPPSAVNWQGLPAAAVTFLANGSLYLPGDSSLVTTGTLNHSMGLVPGRDEMWVTDYAGDQVAVVDLHTQQVVAHIPVGVGPAHMVFSADGRRAWVSDYLSNEVSVIDIASHRVLATIEVGLHPHGLAMSPDGAQIWVACSGGGGMWVLNTRTNAVVSEVPAGIIPHAVAFSPDGRTVYMTDAAPGSLVVVDRATRKVLARVPTNTGSGLVTIARDGSRAYVSGQSGDVVTVVDTHTYQVLNRIPVGVGPHGLALTADGKLLYVAVNGANDVVVIDTVTDRIEARIPVPGAADEVVLPTNR